MVMKARDPLRYYSIAKCIRKVGGATGRAENGILWLGKSGLLLTLMITIADESLTTWDQFL